MKLRRTVKSKALWLGLCSLFVFATDSEVLSQTQLPNVQVTDLRGKAVETAKLANGGRPIVLVFFDTSCKPCLAELNAIADNYEDWMQETGVKLVAISLDDERNVAKVEPYVNSKEWSYEVYLDTAQRLRNALNITTAPTTLLLDGDKNIVWQHDGYQSGDAETILEKIREIGAK